MKNCPYCGEEITKFIPIENYERHYSGSCVDDKSPIKNDFLEESKKGAVYYFGKGELKVVFGDGVVMEMNDRGNVITYPAPKL